MDEKNIPQPTPEKSPAAIREEKTLEFWAKNEIFKKTLEKESPFGEFVFYEGPPTANGKPGIHHLEARSFKDIIPRYKTMQGFHVRRKGGWDTHGLPVELQVEKKLGLSSKKAIEEYGIEKFNRDCKQSVWEYLDIWNTFTRRIGYWVDQEHPYITYENNYIESVWNVLKTVHAKDLLYKDYKVVPWCPRCGTGLSSHELAQGYEDVKDLSVTAKFKIVGVTNGYFLAWTTTPWTLPGNVALAVGKDIIYVEIKIGEEILVLAKERLSTIAEAYEIVAEHKGSEMVGMQYEPLFPYLGELNKGDEKLKNAFKVYEADFVNVTDGTGIVHTAIMYGQDDFELGTKVGLPKFHLVNPDGTFIAGADFLSGRFVKEKDANGKPTVDVDIIEYLKKQNNFYKQESYKHSYPHCWRSHTPLIYYARDSWYIRMSSLRDELVKQNELINWEPAHIREGRFGEWLREIKDWAISRERYWGTPLPIWTTTSGKLEVIGSMDDLKKFAKKSGNSYFVMRHGGTEGNDSGIVSFKNQENDNLTEKGKAQVAKAVDELKFKKIDLIVSSPFIRTRETAEIIREALGLTIADVVFEDKLHEIDAGEFDGKTWDDYHKYIYDTGPGWFDRVIPGGERLRDVQKRTAEVLYDLEGKYKGKNILIVTHGGPAWTLFVNAGMYDPDSKPYQIANTHIFVPEFKRFDNAEIRELPFVPLPHNSDFQIDLHRPYIDTIELVSETGEPMTRVKEVMDVWFDSGVMPFAQDHYPFENKEWIDSKGYPADFISEAIDQTRGWFYTLHAVGILMGRGRAYKNVICLGHILDAQGKKMSKSLGNIVDPWIMMDKYGVDALRMWMYSVNQPGDSKNFDERTVDEIVKKVFNLISNVHTFYALYESELKAEVDPMQSPNILDKWILARLDQLVDQGTQHLDTFHVFEPARSIRDFVDDLSTWYIRRSRERFKGDDESDKAFALATTKHVLIELSKFMAPFTPFFAEDLYQNLTKGTVKESVHLENWPQTETPEAEVDNVLMLEHMEETRRLVTLGLEARQKAGVKVRQPLQKLTASGFQLGGEYEMILKDELNLKEIVFEESKEQKVTLDTTLTPILKQEGMYRELVRMVQDTRKKVGLTPSDRILLTIHTSPALIAIVNQFETEFKKAVLAEKITTAELIRHEATAIESDQSVIEIEKCA